MKPSIPSTLPALILVALFCGTSCSRDEQSEQVKSDHQDPKSGETPTESTSPAPPRRPRPEQRKTPAPKPEFTDLAEKIESGTASDEEQIAFWESVRSSPEFDGMIKDLEALAESGNASVENRLELADLYVLKIVTASSDPIRGVWGEKASKQWQEVLVEDPTNWKAQHSIAYSLSQYPDFLNKTDDSISAYEKLIRFPASDQPDPKQARAFNELSQLYLKRGRPADAKTCLEQGLGRYPDHAELSRSLDTLESQFAFEDSP